MYVHKLDEIVDKYSNIKLTAIAVKKNIYFDFDLQNNAKDPRFKVGNCVGISKFKNAFAKDDTPNWSEDLFIIKILKSENHNGKNIWYLWKRIAENKPNKKVRENLINYMLSGKTMTIR